jgi:hypothetical protein
MGGLSIFLIILGIVFLIIFSFHLRNFGRKYPNLIYVSWLPKPRRGMTIPPFGMFVLKKYKGAKWMKNHEHVHWKQYKKYGLWGFYLRYYYHHFTKGYIKNPMEKEARKKGKWKNSELTDKY